MLEPLIQYLAKWPDEIIFIFEDKMAELLYRLDRVLYPPESRLTVRITPFHAEKSGKPAPAKVMEEAFCQTIPKEAVPIKPEGYSLGGFRCKFFEGAEKEKGEPVCHIYAGYYEKGELLSINIYGESREE